MVGLLTHVFQEWAAEFHTVPIAGIGLEHPKADGSEHLRQNRKKHALLQIFNLADD